MNPLSSLIKKMDPKGQRDQVPTRARQIGKNLQLNMSLVEEDQNDLNDTARTNLDDSSLNISINQSFNSKPQQQGRQNVTNKPPQSPPNSEQPKIDEKKQKLSVNVEKGDKKQQDFIKEKMLEVLNKQQQGYKVKQTQDDMAVTKVQEESLADVAEVKAERKQTYINHSKNASMLELKRKTTIKGVDSIVFPSAKLHRKILSAESDEDEKEKLEINNSENNLSKKSSDSPRSSDLSSNQSPRSSDESSGSSDDEEQDKIKSIKQTQPKPRPTYRMSILELGQILSQDNQDYRRLALSEGSTLEPKITIFKIEALVNLSNKGTIVTLDSFSEEYIISKKILLKNSNIQTLFKWKSQGFIMYTIDPITGFNQHSEEVGYVRSRNATASLGQRWQPPGTPKKARLFSPAQSPSFSATKQMVFPSQEAVQSQKLPLTSEFLVRTIQKARMLRLQPQDVDIILQSSSDEDVRQKQESIASKMFLSQILRRNEDQCQKQEEVLKDSSPYLSSSPPLAEKEQHQKQVRKKLGGILNKALEEEKSKPTFRKVDFIEPKHQFSKAVDQIDIQDESDIDQITSQKRNVFITRRNQITLQDPSFKEELIIKSKKYLNSLLYKLKPFLEDEEDKDEDRLNQVQNSYERLSEKGYTKARLLCFVGLGLIFFLFIIFCTSFIMVEMRLGSNSHE